jgi:2-methylcitrate dehydratase PrpD
MSDTRSDDIAATAAAYATAASLADAPETVRERVPIVLLDTVGVCIRGSEADYVGRVADALAAAGRGPLAEDGATAFATGERRDVSAAATLNAAGGTTLELDEGNQRSAHPGIHTVPPALAAGEHLGASGAELLDAVLAGYEVGARLGDVIRPMRSGLHPHGGWAAVSAAVAVGRLHGFDEATMADAIRNAVNPFVVGHWRAALEGATVRNFYTGLSCQHGIVAAALADSGVTGVYGAIEECLLPYTAARDVTDELLAPFDTFGEDYYLTSSYVKVHAACRYAHAPIEALEAVLADAREAAGTGAGTGVDDGVPFAPEDVASIEVRTFELGTMLDGTDPETVLSAKFSTPFALATRLHTGRSDAEAFTPEQVADDAIRDLADRVSVVADDAFEARAADGEWGAEVTVTLVDGTSHSASVPDARGGTNPFTREEILAKFEALVGTRLPKAATTDLRDRLLDAGDAASVGDVLAPFHRAG